MTGSLSGHALIGMGLGYRVAAMPLVCLIAGCGLGAAWPPVGAKPVGLGRGVDAMAAAVLWPYGALLVLLVLELGFKGWPSSPTTTGFDGHSARVAALFDEGTALSAGRWERSMSWEELHARPFVSAGLAAADRGDLRAAEAAFAKAERLAPHDPDAPMDLGAVRQRLGDRRGAMSAFVRAEKLARAKGLSSVAADASSALAELKRPAPKPAGTPRRTRS
jgi:hypothetical protein